MFGANLEAKKEDVKDRRRDPAALQSAVSKCSSERG